VLFSIINYSRFLKINPESALERTNKKFIRRFKYIETAAKIKGTSIESLSLDEMETFWIAAKNQFSSEDSNS
jgi:XTP/dITP diphosphohydrolase